MIENKKIIIFGAGEKSYAEQIIKKYGEQVAYCIDNDIKKHSTKYKNKYTIYPVEKILEEERGTYIVITTAMYHFNQMSSQLISMGFERNRDFVFAGDILDTNLLKECWENYKAFQDISIKPELNILSLEYSGICNQKCVYCRMHGIEGIYNEYAGLMKFDTIKTIVDKCKEVSTIDTLLLCSCGETFLNKNWYEYTDYILSKMQIKKVIMYTNGMFLTFENAQKLAKLKKYNIQLCLEVSIDGNSPEENNAFRVNSDYKIIKNNIYNALEFLNEEDIVIANRQIIDKNCLKHRDSDVSFGFNTPDFILKDFPKINSFSGFISINENSCITEVLSCEKAKAFINYRSFLCMSIFNTLSINNSGNIALCDCSISRERFCGNIFDDDPVELFYNNHELNNIRKMHIEKNIPKLCCFCGSNIEQFILVK